MDLNICLYCEKPMTDSTTSFCSNVCRNQESKQDTAGGGLNMLRSNSIHSLNRPTPSPPPPSISTSYEIAYHRRQSFSYNTPIMRRPPSNSLSSSSLNSLSSSTLSFDTIKYFHPSTMMNDPSSYPVYTTP